MNSSWLKQIGLVLLLMKWCIYRMHSLNWILFAWSYLYLYSLTWILNLHIKKIKKSLFCFSHCNSQRHVSSMIITITAIKPWKGCRFVGSTGKYITLHHRLQNWLWIPRLPTQTSNDKKAAKVLLMWNKIRKRTCRILFLSQYESSPLCNPFIHKIRFVTNSMLF